MSGSVGIGAFSATGVADADTVADFTVSRVTGEVSRVTGNSVRLGSTAAGNFAAEALDSTGAGDFTGTCTATCAGAGADAAGAADADTAG